MFFTGAAGASVNLLDYPQWRTFENYGNAFSWAKGAWVYYPEAKLDTRKTATYPRLSTSTNENNYTASSFWIRSNNWLRLKNVEAGYSVRGCRVSCVDITFLLLVSFFLNVRWILKLSIMVIHKVVRTI